MPYYSAFDPLDVPYALGSLTVVEVLDGPDFRIRLLATNIQSRLPTFVPGSSLRDFPETDRARIMVPAHEECYHTRRPTHFDSDVTEFKNTRRYRARLWPYMDDEKRVTRIIACRAVLSNDNRPMERQHASESATLSGRTTI